MDLVYKDCVIIYKNGKWIALRATKMTVYNKKNFFTVFDGEEVMAVVPFSEIKTVLFCDVSDAEDLCRAITGD